ncbi:amidohydrolase family protein [Sphingobium sp.]|uniref:amidohydrolase family protein n=1 Tax=Sphingobium sp. TaxID=1912891 RepID=UPI002CD4099B|nr:amidohydrolase family protein [Sphingobium sp.]HUD90644.1 amidohydrolase family protein [Sphingobium sp.]
MSDIIFSADSHLVEPPEIWQRVEPKYRDRAPKVVPMPSGQTVPGEYYVFEELKPILVTNFIGAGHLHDAEKWNKFRPHGFEVAPKSFREPSARLDEQDADGVDGEVIFPTMGMVVLAAKDDALKAACFRAVNSYIAEYCSVDTNRLIGVGVVSLHDLDMAVQDLKDAKKMGLQGVLITGSPEGGFAASQYDRFWATAQDLEMPLTMHDLQVRGEVAFTGTRLNFFLLPMEIQAAFAEMIVGGIFDRFPRLQVVSAENDVGWLPHFVHRLDHFLTKIPMGHNIKRLPSQVVRENFWGSTQFESAMILEYAAKAAGDGRIMWGSDYPHPDSTYPNSRQWIAENSVGLPSETVAKIFGGNVTTLYNVDVQALKNRKKVAAVA